MTGSRYRAIKVHYEPRALERRLAGLGWEVTIRAAGWRFFYASGRRVTAP